ncbi:hypothetical protein KC867_01650, partial [Candidatus Saccharibacteria bacterium]|nr:hypothetical protein [Candidatus Saccharibacteria bacterium]
LQDIMGNIEFDQPAEIEQVKTFIRKNLASDSSVKVQPTVITITVQSASLAGALRQLLHKLKTELGTDKKIFIRIG